MSNCADSIKRINEINQMDFAYREEVIFSGLKCYMKSLLGEYLDESDLQHLADALRTLRNRPYGASVDDLGLEPVTEALRIGSLIIPSKSVRKDELALVFYNLAPYAVLTRRETAQFAKAMFPNLFASVSTICSTLTKFYAADGSLSEIPQSFSVVVLPDHTPETMENICYELGKQSN